MREESTHKVSIINFEELISLYSAYLLEAGEITNLDKISTLRYGIVESEGMHYLINADGIGNSSPLEDERSEIYWYRTSFNEDGKEKSTDCFPFKITEYYYNELMALVSIKEIVSLDKFVRECGSRLDENVRTWDKFLSGKLIAIYDE